MSSSATSTIFSTIRAENRSSGITLTHAAGESYRQSALLCVVNVDLLDHFLRFFIREFLTHIFHHVTLNRCKIWGCRLNSLSDGMVNFVLCDLNRASFSVSQLCEVVHHGDNSCSCVQLLDRCTLIRHLLGRWRRHDLRMVE